MLDVPRQMLLAGGGKLIPGHGAPVAVGLVDRQIAGVLQLCAGWCPDCRSTCRRLGGSPMVESPVFFQVELKFIRPPQTTTRTRSPISRHGTE